MTKGQKITILIASLVIAGLLAWGAIVNASCVYYEAIRGYKRVGDWTLVKFLRDANIYLAILALAGGIFCQFSSKSK